MTREVTFRKRLTAIATATTLLQLIAAANTKVKLQEVGVSFDGTSNTAVPVDVRLCRQTTAGAGGAANTGVLLDKDVSGTIQTTALDASTAFSTEPTLGDVLHPWQIHPQAGMIWVPPPGAEVWIQAGGRLAVKLFTGPASVDISVYMVVDE